jgi:hypothetical protein
LRWISSVEFITRWRSSRPNLRRTRRRR